MPARSTGRVLFDNGRLFLLLAALFPAVAVASPTWASDPDAETLLLDAERPDLLRHWREGAALERRGRAIEHDRPEQAVSLYVDAARSFEDVARGRPELAQAWWRGARSYWLAGETLPVEDKTRRITWFALAEALSGQGIGAHPECAECMLWKFAAMGRLRTTRGTWTGIRQLPEMAELLDRGIALEPTYSDGDENSTLGNLHYSSAIFYRIFPDWFWIGWVVGVRGDKDRALAHIQTALDIHPARLDYQIELGAQLMCLGSARGEPARIREGSEVLRATLGQQAETQDDARELDAARIMLEQPQKSCGYSGDTWIEIDRAQALRAADQAGF